MKTWYLAALVAVAVWAVVEWDAVARAEDAATAEAPAAAPAAEAPQDARLGIPATDDGLPGAGPIRRTACVKGKCREREKQFEAIEGQDHGAIVFFGDSITEGWHDDLRGLFPGLKVANRGIGGDTTHGMLVRLDEDVIALDPAAVVMLM